MIPAQQQRPAHQDQQGSGSQAEGMLQPNIEKMTIRGSGMLSNKVAVIVGGAQGLGRAVAIALAKEAVDIATIYLNAHEDAEITKQRVEETGRSCLLIAGDVEDEAFCQQAIQQIIERFGTIDILVNNALQPPTPQGSENLSPEELERNLQSSLCPMFYMTNAALPYLKDGSTIINTTSIMVNKGQVDYTSSRGAIVTFTRSLSQSLEDKGIRVNGVAPGPVWTMLVPSTVPADQVKAMGERMPTGETSQAEEIAQSIVYLASEDASYMAGQVIFTAQR